MKYRKKPVVIEAHEFKDGFFEDQKVPFEFRSAVCRIPCNGTIGGRPHIHTLEGPHYVIVGDFIIQGVHKEYYPCKHDIFKKTYEPVEAKGEGK